MGAYIELANALYSRIRAAMGTGGNLNDAKKLCMGYRVDTVKQSDCPRITLNINRIDEDYGTSAPRNQIVGNVEFEVELVYPTTNSRNGNRLFSSGFVLDQSYLDANVLYADDHTQAGILYFMERFIDTINTGVDESGAATIDPRLSANSKRAMVVRWDAIEMLGDSFYRVVGYFSTQTKNFNINGRVS